MQAGKLRHRVTLQERVKSRDADSGAVIWSWQTVTSLRAEVVDLSAREFVAARAEQGKITTRITIRFRGDITRSHRLLFEGKIYNIEGILADPKSRREYLTLPCSEGVNDG